MKNFLKKSLFLALISLLIACEVSMANPIYPFEIPVVVVKYFPLKGEHIDIDVTGDWGESLAFTREKTDRLTNEVINSLEQGSRYHAYKNPNAEPSLRYKVVKTYEFLEPLPTVKSSGYPPMTDYNAIMNRIDIANWVEKQGIKEVWIWGYHGNKVGLWESNMSGPYGDISNSNRDPNDLPILSKTYTVYHYNYQRETSEAVEDHMHQIEAIFNHVDRVWFWEKFVGGSNSGGKIVNPGCGWSHYPPNADSDYDWANKKYISTDIEDWKPDGTGQKQTMNCEKWCCDSLKWFIYWMQSVPGKNNGLSYKGSPLPDWWTFIANFDEVMKRGLKLVPLE